MQIIELEKTYENKLDYTKKLLTEKNAVIARLTN